MINTDNSFESVGFRSLRELQSQDGKRSELGQEDFLELMTTQLQNQDPFEPMENGDFLAQIAQFSTVSGIQELQASFEKLSQSLVSNQALQASGLVGRSVLAPTGIAALEQEGGVKGVVEVPASSNEVQVTIHNASGETIRRLQLGSQPAGNAQFQWDGLKDDGTRAAPGSYFVAASGQYEGSQVALDTLLASEVESVTLGGDGGLLLDLRGIGPLDFKEVRQIL
jgi:flagellar basal-body rod modification protein FlgD